MACLLTVSAGEAPTQPLMLPMDQLLKRLDQTQEWMLVPLADYRALIAAATVKAADRPGLFGARIATAEIRGTLVDDHVVAVQATLRITAQGQGPLRCPLFATLPSRLGTLTCNGQPALTVAHGNGLDVVVPGTGTHQVTLSWGIELAGDASSRRGALPLPLAGAASLVLDAASAGAFAGEALVADPAAPGRWRLVRGATAQVPLIWEPGRSGSDQAAVFGIEQLVQAEVLAGPAPLRWVARVIPRRGQSPEHLEVVLPSGWRLTQAIGDGVRALDEPAPGRVRLTLVPGTTTISCDGVRAANAVVALPQVVGAAYQGGLVLLSGAVPFDVATPDTWRRLPSDAQTPGQRYAVAGPDAGVVPQAGALRWGLDVLGSTSVDITNDTRPWTMVQTLAVSDLGARLGDIELKLPAGWRVSALTADQPVWIRQLAGGGDLAELPVGAPLTVVPQAVGVRTLALTLTLHRSDATVTAIQPVVVAGSRRSSHRVSLLAAPSLDVRVTAAEPWRLGVAAGDGLLRAELLATGDTSPVQLAVRPLDPEVGAEAVLYLAPALGDGHWVRLDLRLQVRAGEVDTLRLDLPVLRDARLQIVGGAVSREDDATALRLRARVPLVGEHLLRIEGALDLVQLGKLVRVALTVGARDLPVVVRELVVVQAPPQADLTLNVGPGALALAVDALPSWSRPLPGLPVSAAWRLTSGEAGTYRLDGRALAAAPAGFIDQVVASSQIDPTGTRTVVSARVAAPAVQALPLVIPPGLRLVQATIDGQEVAVRRVGDHTELPLPGRTQVQVALLFSGPPPSNELRLPLPRLGTLPATRTAWTVAVAGGWFARVIDDPAVLALVPDAATGGRPWFGSWFEAPVSYALPVLPALRGGEVATDPRALAVSAPPAPTTGEPQLVLRGHLLRGTRLGGESEVRLQLTPLATLRAWDHVGRVLAVLIAALLVWRGGWSLRLSVGIAGLLLAAALHDWQLSAGPLLAFGEWVGPLTIGAAAVAALLTQRVRVPRAAVSAGLLACLGVLGAGEAPTPVLMGYQRLDPAGVPQDVRVALTRGDLTTLWQRAQGEAIAAPSCDLATGTPRFALAFSDGHLRGTLSVAMAVPGSRWQQVTLPFLPGSVRGVSARQLGGVEPGTVAWAGDAQGGLTITLAAKQQADVVIDLDLPLTRVADGWTVTLPAATLPGGNLLITSGNDLVPWLGERALTPIDGRFSADLPPAAQPLLVSLRRPPLVVARERRLGIDQQVRVRLHDDRLEWQSTLVCTAQGSGVRRLDLTLPPGLSLTTVTGDGVADWTQQGTQGEIIASAERSGTWTITLGGVIARGADATKGSDVLVRVAGTASSTGRLDLTGADSARFVRPDAAGLERVDPLPGADTAVRWIGEPANVVVQWRARDDDLTLAVRATLRVGIDRVRVAAQLELSGTGERDALRIELPLPWQVVQVPGGTTVTWSLVGERRQAILRRATAWNAGSTVELRLEAERAVLGETIVAPDLRPQSGAIAGGRQLWLIGGAGDRRVRLEEDAKQQALALDAALREVGKLAVLSDGERWLQACSWRGAGAPRLSLAAEGALVRVRASHYLVLGQDRVRWSAHLVHAVEQGELTTLRCTLPTSARLLRVRVDGLGTWVLTGRELAVTLAGPSRRDTALDLELELPLAGDGIALDALVVPGATGAQDVALVEEDDLGLVHLDAQGLEPLSDRAVPFTCPIGVELDSIRHRWRTTRPQWTLGVRREALGRTSGIDGVVTLVDVLSVLGADGECRSRGTWQVLNRSRSQLTVRLPAGVELWEARVAGVDVRPRQGVVPGEIVVPVTPQRPGEAAQAITLTWRERLDARHDFSPGAPRFTDLRVMQGLWRVVPPPGFTVRHRGGTLRPVDEVEAEASRAKSLIDEVKRLRGVGELDDAGLKRLNDQLVTLDLQLSDNLVSLQQVDEKSAPNQHQQALNSQVINEVTGNRAELQQDLKRIDGMRTARFERRNRLGLDNTSQSWAKAGGAPVRDPTYAPRALVKTAPPTAPRLSGDANLGVGLPPPGHRQVEQRALLGIDLLGEPGSGGLTLRTQDNDLRLELELARTGGNPRPWISLCLALLVMSAGVWLVRRR